MKSESDLNRRIRSVLCATGAMAVSVESGATQLGIPDIYVRTENTSAWIELKHLYYPIHYPFRVPQNKKGQKSGPVNLLFIITNQLFSFLIPVQLLAVQYILTSFFRMLLVLPLTVPCHNSNSRTLNKHFRSRH